GEALDAWPRSPALGDAERRGARPLAGPGGLRGARPLPLVQGLHPRLPGERRPADAEGRVSLALLRGAAAPTYGVRLRAHRPGGAAGHEGARARQLRHADAAARLAGKAGDGRLPEAS